MQHVNLMSSNSKGGTWDPRRLPGTLKNCLVPDLVDEGCSPVLNMIPIGAASTLIEELDRIPLKLGLLLPLLYLRSTTTRRNLQRRSREYFKTGNNGRFTSFL